MGAGSGAVSGGAYGVGISGCPSGPGVGSGPGTGAGLPRTTSSGVSSALGIALGITSDKYNSGCPLLLAVGTGGSAYGNCVGSNPGGLSLNSPGVRSPRAKSAKVTRPAASRPNTPGSPFGTGRTVLRGVGSFFGGLRGRGAFFGGALRRGARRGMRGIGAGSADPTKTAGTTAATCGLGFGLVPVMTTSGSGGAGFGGSGFTNGGPV